MHNFVISFQLYDTFNLKSTVQKKINCALISAPVTLYLLFRFFVDLVGMVMSAHKIDTVNLILHKQKGFEKKSDAIVVSGNAI